MNSLALMPIVGSDQLTMGLTPTSMHANPGALAVVPVATVAAPASGSSSLVWIALLALAGWYAWKKGWLPI
jgi:hypothetical protein